MVLKGKNLKYWTSTNCQQCGILFAVYKKQIEKGKGNFCSISCATTFRNITDNPTKCVSVREKISKNHADVSGANNPMYGIRGKDAPGYIDGRNSFVGEVYRKKALANYKHICVDCGEDDLELLEVHHIDKNRNNNDLSNLMIVCRKCHRENYHKRVRDEFGRFV